MIDPKRNPRNHWIMVVNCGLIMTLLLAACGKATETDFKQWSVYGGDKGANRYSALDQIDRSNVDQLEMAWTYHTGDKRESPRFSVMECNPIVVDDVMYVTSAGLKVIALRANSGEVIWRFDPFEGREFFSVNRGVTYWEDGDDRRILLTAGPQLLALNAQTGRLIEDFGQSGRVDLRQGLDTDIGGAMMAVSTPGMIYEDLIILGSSVGEGPQPAAPGHIRAYNVRTGERAWIFHTIPHPGEYGYDTWPPDAWERVGAANAWGGMSMDEQRGLVFLGTGSASFDFSGTDREGQNLFANSVVALRASTGERVWHFQVVHHDIWDYDLPTPPSLVTLNQGGELVDAVVQVTKMGMLFVLNRETGEPLFPVEERPVPASTLEGETTWPTQPFPLKPPPFTRQVLTEAEVTNISSKSHDYILDRIRQLDPGKIYTPLSERGTIVFPGYHGGANWGGGAFDPGSGRFYINANEIPMVATMERLVVDPVSSSALSAGEAIYEKNCVACHGQGGEDQPPVYGSLDVIRQNLIKSQLAQLLAEGKGNMPPFSKLNENEVDALYAFLSGIRRPSGDQPSYPYPYVFGGYQRFVDLEGFPAIEPPWGTLTAIDLNQGEMVWQIPLGELAELSGRGVPPTGTENVGGPIVTAGGLIFIGATKDDKFRAFDKDTGILLWETTLPAPGGATPATYSVNGKQYVIIAAGGGRGRRVRGREDRKVGDAFVAFTLPE